MLSLKQTCEVLNSLPDPAFILTQTGRYVAVFGGADTRYYHDPSGLVGLSVKDVLNTEKATWFITKINKALKTNKLLITEYCLEKKDVKGLDNNGPDCTICFEGRIQPLNFTIEGESAVLWQASNITQRFQLEEKLRARSETDSLTGVWNRRYFYHHACQEKNRAKRRNSSISLLILDIDYFKVVNDQFGHIAGDIVLNKIAALMTDCTRDSDIVVRWGGEEFVVFMQDTELKSAYFVAEKIRTTIANNNFCGVGQVTVSIGYAIWDFANESIDELVEKADVALYSAKNKGRNCVQGDHQVLTTITGK